MNAYTDKEFQPVPSGWNFSSVRLKLQFHRIVTMALAGCNCSFGWLQSDSLQVAVRILSASGLRSVHLVSGFYVSVSVSFFWRVIIFRLLFLPPLPSVLGWKTNKNGGSSPFYHLKKSAATTHPNALSIVISVGRVVAVVALLQNFGKGKEDEKIRGNIVRIYKTVIKVKLRVELYLFQTATAHAACNQKPLLWPVFPIYFVPLSPIENQ